MKSATPHWFPVETSRGCVGSCSFCSIPAYWGSYHTRSIESIQGQFTYLALDHGIEEVFIEDDNVSLNKQRFLTLIELLKVHSLKWSTPNGIYIPSLLDKDVLKALESSTCWRLSLPFETGYEPTAKLMNCQNKFIPFSNALNLVNRLKGSGIKTCGFFIIGYPGETMDQAKYTLEYANSLPLDDRHIYLATPYLGTALYRYASDNNLLLHEGEALYHELSYTKTVLKEQYPFLLLREEDRHRALDIKAEK